VKLQIEEDFVPEARQPVDNSWALSGKELAADLYCGNNIVEATRQSESWAQPVEIKGDD